MQEKIPQDKIIQNDFNFLRSKSRETTVEECEQLNIWKRLEAALATHNEEGVGLSAIQIGESIRASFLIYPKSLVTKGAEGIEIKRLVNPRLTKKENYFKYYGERCLSFPDHSANTWRYKKVEVEDDLNGKETYEGLIAVAVQHELDHFEGVIVPDMKIEPIKNEENKVGRNEQCPCGSGKKYKKCCLGK